MNTIAPAEWTAERILNALRQHHTELSALGVRQIGLFGSFVRGEQRPDSDMDFLVTLDNWTWQGWCRLWDFLENQFQRRIDLVPSDDLRPELRPYVLPEVRYVQIA